jgi:hypothetical protein
MSPREGAVSLNRFLSSTRRTYWRVASALRSIDHQGVRIPQDFTAAEIAVINAVRPFTMTASERIVSLLRAIDYLCASGIEGDIVECGVWKGGSMMAAALALKANLDTSRMLHLFDTYEGMPPPSDVDRDFLGNSAADQLQRQTKDAPVWARAQYDEVAQNMRATGYPMERVRMVKGLVEDTIPKHAPETIALLRLDTDWYESTKHEMEHLYPRLVPGGVLILDDYGHWQGARLAVDEYLKAHGVQLLLCRVDMAARIAVKRAPTPPSVRGA